MARTDLSLTDLSPLAFDLLSGFPELVHGVFSRRGGVSRAPFDSLNLGFSTGDDRDAVKENRRRVLDSLGLGRAFFLNQVHGNDIFALDRDTAAPDLFWKPDRPIPAMQVAADGVVANVTDLGLVIQVADCQSVMLYDPGKRVIANVHAGWRGSIRDIPGHCVDIMVQRFGSDPGDIRAGISPSLGPCCGEFVNFRDEIPQRFWQYKEPDRPYFDFRAVTRDQLTDKGVPERHITAMNICTRCNTDRFYSYRKEGVTGRFATVIGLR